MGSCVALMSIKSGTEHLASEIVRSARLSAQNMDLCGDSFLAVQKGTVW